MLGGPALASLAPLSAASCRCESPRPQQARPWPLDEAIEAGTSYLLTHLNEDGSFVYRVNADGSSVTPRYNVLRHAGSIYALADAHDDAPSPALRDAIVRSARFLLERHVDTVRGVGHPGVFSLPDLETRSGERELKLGGCGLGLVALIRARELDEQLVPLETLRGIGRTILFFQQPSGDFKSKFDDVNQKFFDFKSLYYPGETILALTMLYELDPDPLWLNAAARAAGYLTTSRKGVKNLPKDHWLMIASAKLLPHWDTLESPPVPAEEFRQHVLALGRSFVDQQHAVARETGGELGPTMKDERSTPTATTLEGLAAIHGLLLQDDPEERAFRAELERSIRGGARSVMESQLRGGPLRGGVMRAPYQQPGDDERVKEFNARQSEIRIDYVQHALSAFLGAKRIGVVVMDGGGGGGR